MNCRVAKCKENHASHFCSLCQDHDSNHFSCDCTKGITLYHGTKVDNTSGIASEGLKPSKNGRLGPGVYFVESYSEAISIAKHRDREDGNVSVVLECTVSLGQMANLCNVRDSWELQSWQGRYHSAKAVHPPWAGINYSFNEICVKNQTFCSVKKVTFLKDNYGSIDTIEVGKMHKIGTF